MCLKTPEQNAETLVNDLAKSEIVGSKDTHWNATQEWTTRFLKGKNSTSVEKDAFKPDWSMLKTTWKKITQNYLATETLLIFGGRRAVDSPESTTMKHGGRSIV